MRTPRVSILLPFDRADVGLDTAVRSMIQQTFRDWELIAVRNGNNPATRAAAETLADSDPRIRHFTQRGFREWRDFVLAA